MRFVGSLNLFCSVSSVLFSFVSRHHTSVEMMTMGCYYNIDSILRDWMAMFVSCFPVSSEFMMGSSPTPTS